MKRIFLPIVLAFSLAGCAGIPGGLNPEYQAIIVCRAYAATGKILLPFKAKMQKSQVAVVDQSLRVVPPICKAVAAGEDISTASLRVINEALTTFIEIEKDVKK